MPSVRASLLIAGLVTVNAIGAPADDAGRTVGAALAPSVVPMQSAFSMLGNGGIGVIVPHDNVTYIGGNFDELAAITGAFSRLDAVSARRIAPLVETQGGEVRASVPDGAGGFYIGGTFNRVGGVARARIAHILADGSLDPNFNPGVPGQNSAVNALAVSSDSSLVYVGGAFDLIGGQVRHNLAAVQAGTGTVTSFDPAGLGTDGQVFALEVAGTQVYVGGQFQKLGGQVRNGLAKVEATTGGDLGWSPNPTFNGGGGLIFAIEASGDSVYVGGVFTAVGGEPRTHLARVSASSGAAIPGFAPNPDDAVFSLALSGSRLYAGGDFNTITGLSRPALAQLDAGTGALSRFDADLPATDSVRAIALSGTGLFAGGFLTSAGGQARTALAKVDASTGALHPFDASIGDFDATVSVKTLSVVGTSVYVGGDLSFVNKVTRHGIAALDSDGVPTAFNPDAGPSGTFNDVSAIAIRDNAIYLGGNFTTLGGQPRNRIAKVRLDGSLDPNFNPNATGGNIPGIDAIVVTSTDVYVGGDFSSIGGQPRIDLAKLNPTTGLVDGGRQSFDPDPLNGIDPSRVRALVVNGDAVYVAGDFTTIGGQSRAKLAKISGTTGDADVQFNANVSGGSTVGPGVFDVELANSTLYVAGDFSSIGGAARNNVATLNPLTGAEVTGFNPNVTGGTRPQVHEIVVTTDEVYIGGSFTQVGGQPQGQIARLSKTGTLTPFDPKVSDQPGAVLALAISNTMLYTGGLFYEMDGRPRLAYAQFAQASPGDADGDGMPDAWELQYGLYPNAVGQGHATADPDNDGVTNAQEYLQGTHPRGFVKRYLAEGATSDFFQTRLALVNPAAAPARVILQFQKGDATTQSESLLVPGLSRATLDVGTVPGMARAEFSTAVESDEMIVVDRTMSWDSRGYGGHTETALHAPAPAWYLAEGATHSGFNLFYLIQNPNPEDVDVMVTFLLPTGAPISRTYSVAARSRFNVWVNAEGPPLDRTDVSAVITSARPIIVERAMYLDVPGQLFAAGHESAGVTAPSTEWFLAEGATGPYWDLFVLIANPGSAEAQVEATYLLPDGTTLTRPYTVKAKSRFNIWVDLEDARLADTAVSTTIRSTNGVPVIVERAMWWPQGRWFEAHNSPGVTATGTKWALAEGEVDATRDLETYILVANTSAVPAHVKVTLLFEDGSTAERTYPPIAPKSRFNIPVGLDFPQAAGRRFGALVESGGMSAAQIVVERAMYWDAAGQTWAAGTNAVATRLQ